MSTHDLTRHDLSATQRKGNDARGTSEPRRQGHGRTLSIRELIDEFFKVAHALLVEARFQLGDEC